MGKFDCITDVIKNWLFLIYEQLFNIIYLKILQTLITCYVINIFLCPRDEESGGGGGHINLPPVRPSGYRYMVCPAISSYSFGATALIFFRMFIHIMEVCMSTGCWFSSNILKMTGSWRLSHFFHTSCIKGTWFVRLTPPTVLELQL